MAVHPPDWHGGYRGKGIHRINKSVKAVYAVQMNKLPEPLEPLGTSGALDTTESYHEAFRQRSRQAKRLTSAYAVLPDGELRTRPNWSSQDVATHGDDPFGRERVGEHGIITLHLYRPVPGPRDSDYLLLVYASRPMTQAQIEAIAHRIADTIADRTSQGRGTAYGLSVGDAGAHAIGCEEFSKGLSRRLSRPDCARQHLDNFNRALGGEALDPEPFHPEWNTPEANQHWQLVQQEAQTPPDVLQDIYEKYTPHRRRVRTRDLRVAQNRARLLDQYDTLRRRGAIMAGEHDMVRAIARHPNTPPDILYDLAYFAPRELAQNPILPLLRLEDPNWQGHPALERYAQIPDMPDAIRDGWGGRV